MTAARFRIATNAYFKVAVVEAPNPYTRHVISIAGARQGAQRAARRDDGVGRGRRLDQDLLLRAGRAELGLARLPRTGARPTPLSRERRREPFGRSALVVRHSSSARGACRREIRRIRSFDVRAALVAYCSSLLVVRVGRLSFRAPPRLCRFLLVSLRAPRAPRRRRPTSGRHARKKNAEPRSSPTSVLFEAHLDGSPPVLSRSRRATRAGRSSTPPLWRSS